MVTPSWRAPDKRSARPAAEHQPSKMREFLDTTGNRSTYCQYIIPGALYFNLCIDAFGNGDEDVGQPHESVPCVTAPIDDSLIVLINNVAELITSEVLPEIL